MLFFKKRKEESNINRIDPIDVRDRVQAIRNRVGHRETKLGDLFALIGEHERARPPEVRAIVRTAVENPALPRVNPEDVPSLYPVPREVYSFDRYDR
jgi:hypothetical protein